MNAFFKLHQTVENLCVLWYVNYISIKCVVKTTYRKIINFKNENCFTQYIVEIV